MDRINDHLDRAQKMLTSGKSRLEIINSLQSHGASNENASLFENQARRCSYLRKRKRGFVIGLMGIVLLVSGFFLTIFIFNADALIDVTLFGMTSSGVILLLAGIVDLLGW